MDVGAFLALCAALGFVIGRWPAVLLGGALAPLYFVGRDLGWWGASLGDGWPVLIPFGVALFALAGALGVALRYGFRLIERPGA